MNNYPIGAAEDPDAPYNEKIKKITVTISQTLSTTTIITLPVDADENDNFVLEQAVKGQIMLPSDCVENDCLEEDWIIDDFCVV